MQHSKELYIKKAYAAFNQRDIDAVLSVMHPEVHWPNGWEGGYVNGHEEVREYWTRQWKELNPHVHPVSLHQLEDGRVKVEVQQVVKDMEGRVLYEGAVSHVYSFEDTLIKNMEIEN